MNKYLDLSPEVAAANAAGKPVVALESTIISHGMPYPQNVETALRVEQTIRDNGALPATIAVIGGRLKAGLTPEEIEYLGKKGRGVAKASRRDLPVLVARGADGATTVTTTMITAALAGIKVFATGGVGGVHRGAETTMDISADLEELAKTPVMVICAGAKSILDLGLRWSTSRPKVCPLSAMARKNFRHSTPARAASRSIIASTHRKSWQRPSGQNSRWDWKAACLLRIPFRKSTPWIRTGSMPPSTKPSLKRTAWESKGKKRLPSCSPRSRTSPAAIRSLPTSNWF